MDGKRGILRSKIFFFEDAWEGAREGDEKNNVIGIRRRAVKKVLKGDHDKSYEGGRKDESDFSLSKIQSSYQGRGSISFWIEK